MLLSRGPAGPTAFETMAQAVQGTPPCYTSGRWVPSASLTEADARAGNRGPVCM